MDFNHYIPALVLFLALLHEGYTIKCWKCNSYDTPACGSPFDNSTLPLVKCEGQNIKNGQFKLKDNAYCRWYVETKETGNGPKENNLYFERSCGYSFINADHRPPCLQTDDSYKTCYCNSGDGCNDDFGGLE